MVIGLYKNVIDVRAHGNSCINQIDEFMLHS